MRPEHWLRTLDLLVRDTFRQAWASGIFAILLSATAIATALCLSVRVTGDASLQAKDEPGYFLPAAQPRMVVPSVVAVLASRTPLDVAALSHASARQVWYSHQANPAVASSEGVETVRGQVTLAFGAIAVPLGRERGDAIRFVQLVFAAGVAGTLGLLLALIWTAGFMPTFLDPAMASVLLAKPVPRWQLLLGKYLGVLTFVGFQIGLFVGLTWLALGVRTGIWDTAYWWCVPLLLLEFAVFYSFSVLLAVLTRNTVACVLGTLLFWAFAWGINYGHVMALALPEGQLPSATMALADVAYWIAPKPIDFSWILFRALQADPHFAKPDVVQILDSAKGMSPFLSVFTSFITAGLFLGLSVYELNETDY